MGPAEPQEADGQETCEFVRSLVGGERSGVGRRRHVGTMMGVAHSNLRLATGGCLE